MNILWVGNGSTRNRRNGVALSRSDVLVNLGHELLISSSGVGDSSHGTGSTFRGKTIFFFFD